MPYGSHRSPFVTIAAFLILLSTPLGTTLSQAADNDTQSGDQESGDAGDAEQGGKHAPEDPEEKAAQERQQARDKQLKELTDKLDGLPNNAGEDQLKDGLDSLDAIRKSLYDQSNALANKSDERSQRENAEIFKMQEELNRRQQDLMTRLRALPPKAEVGPAPRELVEPGEGRSAGRPGPDSTPPAEDRPVVPEGENKPQTPKATSRSAAGPDNAGKTEEARPRGPASESVVRATEKAASGAIDVLTRMPGFSQAVASMINLRQEIDETGLRPNDSNAKMMRLPKTQDDNLLTAARNLSASQSRSEEQKEADRNRPVSWQFTAGSTNLKGRTLVTTADTPESLANDYAAAQPHSGGFNRKVEINGKEYTSAQVNSELWRSLSLQNSDGKFERFAGAVTRNGTYYAEDSEEGAALYKGETALFSNNLAYLKGRDSVQSEGSSFTRSAREGGTIVHGAKGEEMRVEVLRNDMVTSSPGSAPFSFDSDGNPTGVLRLPSGEVIQGVGVGGYVRIEDADGNVKLDRVTGRGPDGTSVWLEKRGWVSLSGTTSGPARDTAPFNPLFGNVTPVTSPVSRPQPVVPNPRPAPVPPNPNPKPSQQTAPSLETRRTTRPIEGGTPTLLQWVDIM